MSTLGTPTPGRRSPVYSVLDAQYAEAAFRTGPSVSPADTAETTRPAYAESFYSNTAPARVCTAACPSVPWHASADQLYEGPSTGIEGFVHSSARLTIRSCRGFV